MSVERLPDVPWRHLEELTREYARCEARRKAAIAAADEAIRRETAAVRAMEAEAERLITLQHPDWVLPVTGRSKRAQWEATARARDAAGKLVGAIVRRIHD